MRNFIFSAIFAATLAACSSSTAPSWAGDPSILVTNDMTTSWVYITWRDGQGIVGRDSVAPRTASQCVRFLAQPDSAYWDATAAVNGVTAVIRTPSWFNPADRPAWTLRAYEAGNVVPVPVLDQRDAATAC